MNALLPISDHLAVISVIDPQDLTSDGSGDVIDMKLYHRVGFLLCMGAMAAANATADLVIYGGTTSGAQATAITGKSTTDATFSGSAAGNNKQAWIEVDAAEVEAQGLRYIKPTVAVTNSGGLACLIALGVPRYLPAGDYDLASVAEIVN